MNIKWIARIQWGKVLLVGFLYTIIAMVVRQLEVLWTMKYYTMPEFFGVWSKTMMPTAGPPPMEFMIVSAIITFTSGVAITIIYYYLKDYLPKGFWKRSTFFADILVSTSFVFFTLPVFLLFNVPLALLAYWFGSTFVIVLASSMLIVKLIK